MKAFNLQKIRHYQTRLSLKMSTFSGRFLIGAFAFPIFAFLLDPIWAARVIGLLFITLIFSNHRLLILGLLGPAWLLFFNDSDRALINSLFIDSLSSNDTTILYAFSLLIGYVICFTVLRLNNFLKSHTLALSVTVIIGYLISFLYLSKANLYLSASLLIFGQFIWVLLFYLVESIFDSQSENTIISALLMRPVWIFSGAFPYPVGKNINYLNSNRCNPNSTHFAQTQIKGIALIIWAAFLKMILLYLLDFENAIIGQTFNDVVLQIAGKSSITSFPIWKAWLSLILFFIKNSLELFVWGHSIIGFLWLIGVDIKRNSNAPFLAHNISDFFNRFDYYYKELLYKIFFLPTFINLRIKNQKLRQFLSIFMAAGVGNMLYHITTGQDRIVRYGLWGAICSWKIQFIYCLLLTVGIFYSEKIESKTSGLFFRIFNIFKVFFFFLILHIFYSDQGNESIHDRLHFFLFLFSLVH